MNIQQKSKKTEAPFTDQERRVLLMLVDMIIPASDEFGVPGAGDNTIFADILATAKPHHSLLRQALLAIDRLPGTSQASGISERTEEQRQDVADAFRRSHPAEAEILETLTMQCYYRDDRVMLSLGMEARPPFPSGFPLEQGDWALLDPVRARPEFYRKVP